jgi:hypothetical protein
MDGPRSFIRFNLSCSQASTHFYQEMANQNGIHAVDEVDSIENKEAEEKSDSNKQEE